MSINTRIFTRELVRKVNQDMINRKPVDTSSLPKTVVASIKMSKLSRDEISQAFAKARRRLAGV